MHAFWNYAKFSIVTKTTLLSHDIKLSIVCCYVYVFDVVAFLFQHKLELETLSLSKFKKTVSIVLS